MVQQDKLNVVRVSVLSSKQSLPMNIKSPVIRVNDNILEIPSQEELANILRSENINYWYGRQIWQSGVLYMQISATMVVMIDLFEYYYLKEKRHISI